jgi:hypothetical protein
MIDSHGRLGSGAANRARCERATSRAAIISANGGMRMCCLISTLFLLGPRAAIVVWWLLQPARWAAAFDTVLWPMVGFLLLPWMTLMFVVVAPGGVEGFDYVWLIIGLAMDLFTWGGGAFTNRDRMPTATT